MADVFNIEVDQGAEFTLLVTCARKGVPVDLTGYQARGQVRKTRLGAQVAATFVCTVELPPTQGIVRCFLPDDETSGLSCGEKRSDKLSLYVYDTDVIDATVDANGNRLSVALDV